MRIHSYNLVKISTVLIIIFYGLPILNCVPGLIRVCISYFIIITGIAGVLSQKDNNRSLVVISMVMLFILLIYFGEGFRLSDISFEQKARSLMMFFLPMILGSYWIENKNKTNIRLDFLLLVFFFTCVTTILGILVFPKAPRILAKSGDIDKSIYYIRNIGGYGYIYSIVFLFPYLSELKKRVQSSKRLLYTIFQVLIIICVFMSQYTTAMILIIVELPFVLSKNMNYKYYIILSSITVLLVHLFVDFNLIINHLSDFANNLNLPIIANRLDNFNQVVFYDSTGGDFYKRTNLYLKSFNAFCHSPIWGNLFSKSYRDLGGHSELIDMLGGIGLIGLSVFIMFTKRTSDIYLKSCKDFTFKSVFEFEVLLIIILMLLNTLFVAHQISIIFYLCPILFMHNTDELNIEKEDIIL